MPRGRKKRISFGELTGERLFAAEDVLIVEHEAEEGLHSIFTKDELMIINARLNNQADTESRKKVSMERES